jgi:hypothetical protein
MNGNLRTLRLLTAATLRILFTRHPRPLRKEIMMMRLEETFGLVPLHADGDR